MSSAYTLTDAHRFLAAHGVCHRHVPLARVEIDEPKAPALVTLVQQGPWLRAAVGTRLGGFLGSFDVFNHDTLRVLLEDFLIPVGPRQRPDVLDAFGAP